MTFATLDSIKVLDHGYVKLIASMGSDEAIVYHRCKRAGCEIAEVERADGLRHSSCCVFDADGKNYTAVGAHEWQDFPRGDLAMLEFMWKNRHATPFEFGELHIEVQAPIFVFREWHRHRTQSFSEFSARYSQMVDLHYVPELSRIQKQSTSNRQGSGEPFDADEAQGIVDSFAFNQSALYDQYDDLVRRGVAKEVARINTPVSRYSKMRAKTDLRNWLAFLTLRMAPSAQWEIRQYANAVAELVKSIWPRTFALFEEHTLHAVTLSRSEALLVADSLENQYQGRGTPEEDAAEKKLIARLRGGA